MQNVDRLMLIIAKEAWEIRAHGPHSSMTLFTHMDIISQNFSISRDFYGEMNKKFSLR